MVDKLVLTGLHKRFTFLCWFVFTTASLIDESNAQVKQALAHKHSSASLETPKPKNQENRQPVEFAWFNGQSSPRVTLIRQLPECISPSDTGSYHLGRLAFNSPRLLGGQAGRMGLSCASCHPSARFNSQFFIEQISDKPGKADISHHFLSSSGGDNQFNPKPIPDLANIAGLKFKIRNGAAFERLLSRLIEVEFDGQKPDTAVFEALKTYLGNNNIDDCENSNNEMMRSLTTDWRLIENGLFALREYPQIATTRFITDSMRSVLEIFYRFYSLRPNSSLDERLISLSRSLESFPHRTALSVGVGAADLAPTRPVLIQQLKTSLDQLKLELLKYESQSYYNSGFLPPHPDH